MIVIQKIYDKIVATWDSTNLWDDATYQAFDAISGWQQKGISRSIDREWNYSESVLNQLKTLASQYPNEIKVIENRINNIDNTFTHFTIQDFYNLPGTTTTFYINLGVQPGLWSRTTIDISSRYVYWLGDISVTEIAETITVKTRIGSLVNSTNSVVTAPAFAIGLDGFIYYKFTTGDIQHHGLDVLTRIGIGVGDQNKAGIWTTTAPTIYKSWVNAA